VTRVSPGVWEVGGFGVRVVQIIARVRVPQIIVRVAQIIARVAEIGARVAQIIVKVAEITASGIAINGRLQRRSPDLSM
jgi:hypothetical protein